MLKKRKIALVMAFVGAILLLLPTVTQSLNVVNTGDSLDNWATEYSSLSLDTTTFYDSPSSIAWSTNMTDSNWHSYLRYFTGPYGVWSDWRSTPIFTAKVNPQLIPSIATFQIELVTAEGGWTEYAYGSSQLTVGVWNNVTVDLRNSLTGIPNLAMVRAVSFHWVLNGYVGSDFVTNVDLLEVFPSGPIATLTVESTTNGYLSLSSGVYTYSQGASIEVTAIPDSGYELDYFVLDGANAGKSSDNSITVVMDVDHTLGAVFKALPTPPTTATITITNTTGGTTDPVEGTYDYDVGTTIVLTATPSSGYRFVHWSSVQDYTDNPLTFTVDSDATFNAVFELVPQPPASPSSWPIQPLSLVGAGLLIASVFVATRRDKT